MESRILDLSSKKKTYCRLKPSKSSTSEPNQQSSRAYQKTAHTPLPAKTGVWVTRIPDAGDASWNACIHHRGVRASSLDDQLGAKFGIARRMYVPRKRATTAIFWACRHSAAIDLIMFRRSSVAGNSCLKKNTGAGLWGR